MVTTQPGGRPENSTRSRARRTARHSAVVWRLSGGEAMASRYTCGAGSVTVTAPPGWLSHASTGTVKSVLPGGRMDAMLLCFVYVGGAVWYG